MLGTDPEGRAGPAKPLPDAVVIYEPKVRNFAPVTDSD